jgi:hypothetical protein
LDHDGKQEFVHSARLKGLMDRTDRRFKVVFAGLHNVQRTTRQSNHPLAHYQEPICIGPLLDNGEWREARSLIERPLASLGYRFESPDLVTRILSQTNYYPSLIQLYCKELLQHVSNHKVEFFDPRATPPFIITAKHVEGAYQSQELRNTIRQKLSLTLQLDPRYEVIAYALAFHFLSTDPDAVVSGVPVSWIRNQALDWWADGFKDANSDDSIRVLADEMVGLGVFRQVAPDCYTLRSPNVISLLGDPRQIASELERSRELPPEFEAATFRGVFPDKDAVGGLWRSPLTAEQQAELRSRENGVSILFGCEAAGLKDLAAALPAAVESEFYVGVNDAELSTFRDLLGGLGNREKNGTTLFHVAPSCSWDQVWVHEAMERLERLTSTTAFVRFLFIADATKTFELLTKNGDLLLPKSPRMRAISLRPWHDAAIRQWLEDSHLPSDKPHREKIYQATGNWSLLLRQLHGASLDDPGHFELHIQKIADSLVSTAWATEISRSLGLYLSEPATLLTTLVQLERATQEELTYVVDGASSDSIRRSLRWADLLGLATRTRSNEWVVDPVVARILTILRK